MANFSIFGDEFFNLGRQLVVLQFDYYAMVVILSVAVFQA
jgi:hypothetical protein